MKWNEIRKIDDQPPSLLLMINQEKDWSKAISSNLLTIRGGLLPNPAINQKTTLNNIHLPKISFKTLHFSGSLISTKPYVSFVFLNPFTYKFPFLTNVYIAVLTMNPVNSAVLFSWINSVFMSQ